MSDVPTLQMLVDWANIGIVISLALSFVFGAASIWLGGKLGRLKDAQSEEAQRNFELSLALQQERAASAEKALLELQERQRPRLIDPTAVLAALKGKPAGTVIILCDPTVNDSYDPLGMQLETALGMAGWKVSMRRSVASLTPEPDEGLTMPIPTLYREGVTIEGILEDCEEKNTPYCSLYDAFKAGGVDFQAVRADALKKDTFRILIGRRRPFYPPAEEK